MKHFFYNNHKILLETFETQTSQLLRPFRLSGTRKNLQVPEKWINGSFKNHHIESYKYLDKKGGFIEFEFDFNNKFIGLWIKKDYTTFQQ